MIEHRRELALVEISFEHLYDLDGNFETEWTTVLAWVDYLEDVYEEDGVDFSEILDDSIDLVDYDEVVELLEERGYVDVRSIKVLEIKDIWT